MIFGMNNKKKSKGKRDTLLKLFENIVADSIFCNEDYYVESEEIVATIAQCFLEEISSMEYDNNIGEWKEILSNVIQDVGGYSSDVIDDVIMELVNQGGVEFVKRMKEEDAEDINEIDHLYPGMLIKVIEELTNTWMDGRILEICTEKCSETSETNEKQILVLIIKYNKKQWCDLKDISFSTEDIWEDAGEGKCLLCLRTIPLTHHHLIPKTMHAHYLTKQKKKKNRETAGRNNADNADTLYTRQMLNNCIAICRPCHSCVHKSENEETLAEKYNTLEKLKQHPEIQKFIGYISTQKNSKHNSDTRLKPVSNKKIKRGRRCKN